MKITFKYILLIFLFSCTRNNSNQESPLIREEPKKQQPVLDYSKKDNILIAQRGFISSAIRPTNDTNYIVYFLQVYSGYVDIETKHWERTNLIPFVVSVSRNVKAVVIGNKKQVINGPGEYFMRVPLDLEGGYNRIPVKAVSHKNITTEGYIEVDVTFNR